MLIFSISISAFGMTALVESCTEPLMLAFAPTAWPYAELDNPRARTSTPAHLAMIQALVFMIPPSNCCSGWLRDPIYPIPHHPGRKASLNHHLYLSYGNAPVNEIIGNMKLRIIWNLEYRMHLSPILLG